VGISALITGCILVTLIPQWVNNRRLDHFATHLFTYPLPPKTRIVDTNAVVGLLGNGNHCDFIATQTLESELSRAEIEQYYRNVTLPGIESDAPLEPNGRVSVHLAFVESSSADIVVRFTTRIAEVGDPAGLDWRCH
jgi:hypothetical protein